MIFYVLVFTAQPAKHSVYIVEYDSSGNAVGGQTMTVSPRRTVTETYWPNNNVYSLEVEIELLDKWRRINSFW